MAVAAAPAAQGAQCVDSSDAAFDSAGIAVSETWRRTARSCELLRLSRVPRLQRFRSPDAPARRICARSSAGQLPGRRNLDLGESSPINSATALNSSPAGWHYSAVCPRGSDKRLGSAYFYSALPSIAG